MTPCYTSRSFLSFFLLLLCVANLSVAKTNQTTWTPAQDDCPYPLTLCNEVESWPETFLDDILEPYFKDPWDAAVPGDREYIWWALAGGETGRWWWDVEEEQSRKHVHDSEEEDANSRPDRAFGLIKREHEEIAESNRRLQELSDERWKPGGEGFCCRKEEKCLGLSVDRSVVVCMDEE